MCRLIETICVKDGDIQHLSDHQDRLDQAIRHFFGLQCTIPVLKSILKVPDEARVGLYKCRVVYSNTIENITWTPYQIREITSLSLIRADDLDYTWKYENRSAFTRLIQDAGTDDIIIVKDGFITDSSYTNLLFYRNNGWFTPSTPLLQGTRRKRLLKSGIIREVEIRPQDLQRYDRLKLINAMLDMNTAPEFLIDDNARFKSML